ncbi:DUF5366 family protein [Domibacillus epiphyticus]|uniref:YufK family protein n=1 Tax=Domibacillus epiphyticus TaxID=1714355 RepID=A0A1V2A9W9_9BACI|nr:DUF5366 family protein [Domibacillus epiphyticus]OMP67786.1 hypothetical protein BTO28_04680 [Domibacillus epiphyticus]
MKNSYLTGYMPLLAILLFSLSLAIYAQTLVVDLLKKANLYTGMLDFFTKTEMNLVVIGGLMVVFTMIFATLKLLANTANELALLFFSKDTEGELLKKARFGAVIFFIGGLISLISFSSAAGIIIIFLVTAMAYIVYFVYKISPHITTPQMIGIIVFEALFWIFFGLLLALILMKLYNGILASLPL